MIKAPFYLPQTVVYLKIDKKVVMGYISHCEHNGSGWVYHLVGIEGDFKRDQFRVFNDNPFTGHSELSLQPS